MGLFFKQFLTINMWKKISDIPKRKPFLEFFKETYGDAHSNSNASLKAFFIFLEIAS